jgi:hypothetical protein
MTMRQKIICNYSGTCPAIKWRALDPAELCQSIIKYMWVPMKPTIPRFTRRLGRNGLHHRMRSADKNIRL